MKLRIFIAGLLIGAGAFAADTGAELFQKARTQETAAGNLEEAIKLYQCVAKEFASDRALAAKALVAEARCYEKLGQDKAGRAAKLYEQVTHDYKDQRELVATANARLAALRQGEHPPSPATMAQRKVEFPDSAPAYLQTDGKRSVFEDSVTHTLTMSDGAGGKRVIFNLKERMLSTLMLSRDASLVFMNLYKPDTTRAFGVVRADGSGFHEIGAGLRLCNPNAEISWDNRYILLCRSQPGNPPELLRVSVVDGEIRKIGLPMEVFTGSRRTAASSHTLLQPEKLLSCRVLAERHNRLPISWRTGRATDVI